MTQGLCCLTLVVWTVIVTASPLPQQGIVVTNMLITYDTNEVTKAFIYKINIDWFSICDNWPQMEALPWAM